MIRPDMDYFEFDPPQALRRHVQCVWRLRDPSPSTEPQTIYPDGRCELITHLGQPMRFFEPDGGNYGRTAGGICGAHR